MGGESHGRSGSPKWTIDVAQGMDNDWPSREKTEDGDFVYYIPCFTLS